VSGQRNQFGSQAKHFNIVSFIMKKQTLSVVQVLPRQAQQAAVPGFFWLNFAEIAGRYSLGRGAVLQYRRHGYIT